MQFGVKQKREHVMTEERLGFGSGGSGVGWSCVQYVFLYVILAHRSMTFRGISVEIMFGGMWWCDTRRLVIRDHLSRMSGWIGRMNWFSSG